MSCTELPGCRPTRTNSNPNGDETFPRKILPQNIRQEGWPSSAGQEGAVQALRYCRLSVEMFDPRLRKWTNYVQMFVTYTSTEMHVSYASWKPAWLHPGTLYMQCYGFGRPRACKGDRMADSCKSPGVGICMNVNSNWCNNWTLKEWACTSNHELLLLYHAHFTCQEKCSRFLL